MKRTRQLFIISGVSLLLIFLMVLFLSPSLLFAPTITIIGADYKKASSDQLSVLTKTDFANPETVAQFPLSFGKWQGYDYDTAYVQKALGTQSVLMRIYEPNTFSQPLAFTIVQSKTDTSFHAPRFCLVSQGTVLEESFDRITIKDPAWTRDNVSITIPINKFVVYKYSKEGNLIERALVVLFYVKGNQFYSDEITMIQVQGLIPLKGPYDDTYIEIQEFLSYAIPLMFQPTEQSYSPPLFDALVERGFSGYLIITIMFLVPAGLVIFPFMRPRK